MSKIPGELRSRLDAQGNLWLEEWLSDPFHDAILPRLHFLIEQEQWDELADAFSRRISVGTGGMRGAVGLGPNRFNHETLGRAVQGHSEFLKAQNPEHFAEGAEAPTLVIAFDVRRFHDKRGIYAGFDEEDPLTAISSCDFARFAAIGYALHGIRTMISDEGDPFVSTPELSCAIRRGGHLAGLNLSASHNHPDDNGVKFYDSSGGQLSGLPGDMLQDAIWSAELPDPISDEDGHAALQLVGDYDPADHEAFISASVRGIETGSGSSIVYCPLEGTGADCVSVALERAFPGVHIVGGVGDGSFDSVPYGLPNPEITDVFKPSLALADEVGASLIMATDPDADRLGAMVRNREGEWEVLVGNQIGVVLLEWLCRKEKGDLTERALIQTCVTGEETVRLAESRGLAIVSDLPVGFKFIARAIDEMERRGKRMLLAFEESLGYLRNSDLREKDATGAATLLAEAHVTLQDQGSSISELYRELNLRHGHHRSGTRSVVMTGPEGVESQNRMIEVMRSQGRLPGTEVEITRDYSEDPCALIDLSAPGDRSSLNVLELRGKLSGTPTRICIRRSGTEPKIKLYTEIHGNPDASLDDITYEAVRSILTLCDLHYTRVCHVLPDHIPLADKLAFEANIGPELLRLFEESGKLSSTPALDKFLGFYEGAALDSLFEALWRLGGDGMDVGALDDFIYRLRDR